LSIDPILAVPGMREAMAGSRAPVVAVAPIISGRAVKGPTAKMMEELGLSVTAAAIAKHYGDILDGYLVDHSDAGTVACRGVKVASAATLMTTLAEREELAREALRFADSLRRARAEPTGASA